MWAGPKSAGFGRLGVQGAWCMGPGANVCWIRLTWWPGCVLYGPVPMSAVFGRLGGQGACCMGAGPKSARFGRLGGQGAWCMGIGPKSAGFGKLGSQGAWCMGLAPYLLDSADLVARVRGVWACPQVGWIRPTWWPGCVVHGGWPHVCWIRRLGGQGAHSMGWSPSLLDSAAVVSRVRDVWGGPQVCWTRQTG